MQAFWNAEADEAVVERVVERYGPGVPSVRVEGGTGILAKINGEK